jgi:sugar phosphate isomerase/epimerase
MIELCFNCMNRSAYLLGDEDPDLPGQFRAAAAAGFRLVGPDFYSIQRYCEQGGSLEGLAEEIAKAGLETFELPTLMLNSNVDAVRRDVEAISAAARVLRPTFVQVNVDSEVDDVVIAETRRAAEIFGALGAELAVEYLPWLPSTKTLESTRRFVADAGDARVGVLVDSWHFFHSDDTWAQLDALPLEEISYVQFDDHPALASDDLVAETLGRRVMPGEGIFELERFCDVIRSKGFDGVVSCEILSEETRRMDLEEFARRVYETSARFWQ